MLIQGNLDGYPTSVTNPVGSGTHTRYDKSIRDSKTVFRWVTDTGAVGPTPGATRSNTMLTFQISDYFTSVDLVYHRHCVQTDSVRFRATESGVRHLFDSVGQCLGQFHFRQFDDICDTGQTSRRRSTTGLTTATMFGEAVRHRRTAAR